MSIGATRYWIGVEHPTYGWYLLSVTNVRPTDTDGYDVIDRGPINTWTGKPHEPSS